MLMRVDLEQIIGLTAGSSAVLECVGTQSSWTTAIAVARELAAFVWDIGRLGMACAIPTPQASA